MKFPLIIYRTANGYMTSPVPIDEEIPPEPEELHVFSDLDALFDAIRKAPNPEPEATTSTFDDTHEPELFPVIDEEEEAC